MRLLVLTEDKPPGQPSAHTIFRPPEISWQCPRNRPTPGALLGAHWPPQPSARSNDGAQGSPPHRPGGPDGSGPLGRKGIKIYKDHEDVEKMKGIMGINENNRSELIRMAEYS